MDGVRNVTALVAAGAILLSACTLAAGTGPEDVATVGFLRAVETPAAGQSAMEDELRRAGFVVGRNLELLGADPLEAYPDPEDAAETVRAWSREGLDVLIALSTSSARAAADALTDTPIVFISNDPRAVGLVTDEEAPEGQLTGVTYRVPADRTLDVVRRAMPELHHVGLVYPDTDPAALPHREAVTAAADELGLQLTSEPFSSPEDVDRAVQVLTDAGAQAVVISNAPAAIAALGEVNAAANQRSLPTVANTGVADGAMVILAPNSEELFRQVGRQATRLLRGADPSEVPVEDPRHFVVLLDAEVARMLDVELPADLVREADEVRGGGTG